MVIMSVMLVLVIGSSLLPPGKLQSYPFWRMRHSASVMAAAKIDAAEFSSLLHRRTFTQKTYLGVPLADEDVVTRGRVLTTLAKALDAERHPDAVLEEAGADERRGRSSVPYDWRRDGLRVACKSTQLMWLAGHRYRYWKLQFTDVKLGGGQGHEAAFDELLLAVYTPVGIYLYLHDGRLGVSSNGRSTAAAGRSLQVYGPAGEEDWEVALRDSLLPKFDESGCERLAFVPFDDPRFLAARAAHPPTVTSLAYAGVPLADCSANARGDLLTAMVGEVDAALHPGAHFEEAVAARSESGARAQKAPYDWRRDGRRVACKVPAPIEPVLPHLYAAPSRFSHLFLFASAPKQVSSLIWSRGTRRWKLAFQRVKRGGVDTEHEAAFDELLLAAYTPRGVYLYRHHGQLGLGQAGETTAAMAGQLQVYGPSGEEEWAVALDEAVLPKLDASGCELLAEVTWQWLPAIGRWQGFY